VKILGEKPTTERHAYACDHCQRKAPTAGSDALALAAALHIAGFKPRQSAMEILLICPRCLPLYETPQERKVLDAPEISRHALPSDAGL